MDAAGMSPVPRPLTFSCQMCGLPLEVEDNGIEDEGQTLFEDLVDEPHLQFNVSAPGVTRNRSIVRSGRFEVNSSSGLDHSLERTPANEPTVSFLPVKPSPLPDMPQTLLPPSSHTHEEPPSSLTTPLPTEGRDKKLEVVQKLFDVATQKTQVDHPLCYDCMEQVLSNLERQGEEAQHEYDTYHAYLEALEATVEEAVPEDVFQQEMDEMLQLEEQLKEKILKVEEERSALHNEEKTLLQERKELEALDRRYWCDFNEYQLQLQKAQEERDSMRRKIEHVSEQLEKLKKTNVYDDAFHIWHDGHFGTINNFRLGRLPSQPVEWAEINAALGQAALLLDTMAKHKGFTFTTYKIIPMGSFSRMQKLNDTNTYEMYGSSDGSLWRLFWCGRFDKAMVWFLACLKEFGMHAEAEDPTFQLPYRIENDKIGDLSTQVGFNQSEKWTKALKYMLTDLKWLLAWMVQSS